MQLTWKLAPPTFVVAFTCLGLLAFLNLHKFEDLLDNVWMSRIRVTAIDSRLALENSLSLGLGLGDSGNSQAVIDRARAAEADIVAAHVVDLHAARGAVLFSSGRVLRKVPGQWLRQQESADRSSWRLHVGEGRHVLGWPLVDPLDRVVGMLVFEAASARQADMVAEAGRKVWVALAVLGTALAFAIALVMRHILAPLEDSLARAQSLLSEGEPGPAAGELEQLAWRYRQAVGGDVAEKGSDGR